MPSRLTDGLPITTEWLNSLVDAINDIQANTGPSFNHLASSINGGSGLIVESGIHTGLVSANTYDATVEFKSGFTDQNIVVVTTPAFLVGGTGGRKLLPFEAITSVGSITRTNFKLSVFMDNQTEIGATTSKTVVVNYIAIGK